ncbi:branched-chain amino acid ABC transporter permease [Desulfogranum marinum]|jgi:branched-chain amino acid transport system permease protein|uniref:branched-chain amino acid ABC transporter permease n=1 Tax=Desulfogranum marinum TaxID=453220 RepID=UPI00196454E0|nr:branched-chain amino acid ABC transporter permease [Desulfogranum marinum]MBM9512044.1 branched-chain amino acid ABC transporter permease [Desulfogranum marinum]
MEYGLHILILCLIYILFSSSLNLELGYAGLYNFGHVGFFAIGAYSSALVTVAGYPIWGGLLLSMVVAAVVGLLFAWPVLRLTGDYFGIASLAFAEMIRLLLLNERWLTRGPMGIPGIPRIEILGLSANMAALIVIFLLTTLSLLCFKIILSSPFGRTLKLIREDEYVARAFGKNVVSFKIRTIAVGSAFGGLAGGLWAHYIGYISPNDFSLQLTVLVILCVVLGGRGTLFGPILGSLLVITVGEGLRFLPLPASMTAGVAHIQSMLFGLVLVLLMLRRPQGIVAESHLLQET